MRDLRHAKACPRKPCEPVGARGQARLAARPDAHRRALRGLLAAAQAAGDERLLRNAYLALSAMMAADRGLFGAPAP